MLASLPLHAQTVDDGVMLHKATLMGGNLYTHDSWDHYWEGNRNRVNGNIGTVTTQSVSWVADYALFTRLNFLVSLPYVWTRASQAVLHGQKGVQDITLASKFSVFQLPVKQIGALRGIAVFSTGLPLTDYSPDLQPLSLGTHSKRITGRATLNYQGNNGLYLNGSAGYTFRGNVKLDRSSYYTNGQLYLSNEVAMPNQFDYVVAAGYRKNNWMLTGNFWQQQTRGGGDIRRQDLPFVSNRTNFSKAGGTAMIPIPRLNNLQFSFAYANTFDGRNVGQANTFTTGLMYTLNFDRRASK